MASGSEREVRWVLTRLDLGGAVLASCEGSSRAFARSSTAGSSSSCALSSTAPSVNDIASMVRATGEVPEPEGHVDEGGVAVDKLEREPLADQPPLLLGLGCVSLELDQGGFHMTEGGSGGECEEQVARLEGVHCNTVVCVCVQVLVEEHDAYLQRYQQAQQGQGGEAAHLLAVGLLGCFLRQLRDELLVLAAVHTPGIGQLRAAPLPGLQEVRGPQRDGDAEDRQQGRVHLPEQHLVHEHHRPHEHQ
eukprot:CAMPEP_0173291416 /NCGR_PEP_ID=MMETSP1143-20121109/12144_1 /TAXON_ID=483371 /ORGANISM="non described non described, Strain CCMP2298" /LENGTH=247 /DNA_ID=CAMNT_0014230657 /DNA_START=1037 /DNA_END=1776 /DNA_ORIENTATION=-